MNKNIPTLFDVLKEESNSEIVNEQLSENNYMKLEYKIIKTLNYNYGNKIF